MSENDQSNTENAAPVAQPAAQEAGSQATPLETSSQTTLFPLLPAGNVTNPKLLEKVPTAKYGVMAWGAREIPGGIAFSLPPGGLTVPVISAVFGRPALSTASLSDAGHIFPVLAALPEFRKLLLSKYQSYPWKSFNEGDGPAALKSVANNVQGSLTSIASHVSKNVWHAPSVVPIHYYKKTSQKIAPGEEIVNSKWDTAPDDRKGWVMAEKVYLLGEEDAHLGLYGHHCYGNLGGVGSHLHVSTSGRISDAGYCGVESVLVSPSSDLLYTDYVTLPSFSVDRDQFKTSMTLNIYSQENKEYHNGAPALAAMNGFDNYRLEETVFAESMKALYMKGFYSRDQPDIKDLHASSEYKSALISTAKLFTANLTGVSASPTDPNIRNRSGAPMAVYREDLTLESFSKDGEPYAVVDIVVVSDTGVLMKEFLEVSGWFLENGELDWEKFGRDMRVQGIDGLASQDVEGYVVKALAEAINGGFQPGRTAACIFPGFVRLVAQELQAVTASDYKFSEDDRRDLRYASVKGDMYSFVHALNALRSLPQRSAASSRSSLASFAMSSSLTPTLCAEETRYGIGVRRMKIYLGAHPNDINSWIFNGQRGQALRLMAYSTAKDGYLVTKEGVTVKFDGYDPIKLFPSVVASNPSGTSESSQGVRRAIAGYPGIPLSPLMATIHSSRVGIPRGEEFNYLQSFLYMIYQGSGSSISTPITHVVGKLIPYMLFEVLPSSVWGKVFQGGFSSLYSEEEFVSNCVFASYEYSPGKNPGETVEGTPSPRTVHTWSPLQAKSLFEKVLTSPRGAVIPDREIKPIISKLVSILAGKAELPDDPDTPKDLVSGESMFETLRRCVKMAVATSVISGLESVTSRVEYLVNEWNFRLCRAGFECKKDSIIECLDFGVPPRVNTWLATLQETYPLYGKYVERIAARKVFRALPDLAALADDLKDLDILLEEYTPEGLIRVLVEAQTTQDPFEIANSIKAKAQEMVDAIKAQNAANEEKTGNPQNT